MLHSYLLRIIALAMLIMPVNLLAASLDVRWDANTEDDLAGYRVYYGNNPGQYGAPVDVGNVTNCSVADVNAGSTYYVAVTAYDTSNNESTFSEEVSAYIPVPDTTPPSGNISINAGDSLTSTRTVSLALSATDTQGSVVSMRISNDGSNWSEGAYRTSQSWVLPEGDGTKTVYALFGDASGNWMSSPVTDTIELKLDTDGDGMPDAWETAHGLDPSNATDAAADADNDGISNYEEYANSSDPTNAADNSPVAIAGSDIVTDPTRVTFDGSGNDPNGDSLTFEWSQSTGPVNVEIEDATSTSASFVATKAGSYDFSLTCFDGKASASDSVNVKVNNVAPSVTVGNDMVIDAGQPITLHASGTDPNDDSLVYSWAQVSGNSVDLSQSGDADLTLVLDEAGLYRFSVIANDGALDSPADEIAVTVNDTNRAPVAMAGVDVDVQWQERVVLNGGASTDPDGDSLTFAWKQISGAAVVLNDETSATPWFEATVEGSLEFELVVSDANVSSTPDTVVIRVLRQNSAPVANAGNDLQTDVGTAVVLDGSASYDDDGQSLGYTWTQISGASVTLEGADSATAGFTPTTSGVLEFRLSVSDGQASATDTVQVTVNSLNQVPVADAGDDITVISGEMAVLDGSQSYDPDGDEIAFIWSQPSGSRTATLDDPNSVTPSFVADEPGTYLFELRVYDGKDTSRFDTVVVTVEAEPSAISLLSPSADSSVRGNPVFKWTGENIGRYTLNISLNGGNYYRAYSGSRTSYSLHPILWYWFIPSNTTISWYVSGNDGSADVTSVVSTFRKR